jgi:hypothetical protein
MARRLVWITVILLVGFATSGNSGSAGKTSVVKGTLYRGDKSHPVSGAVIVLLDEKKNEKSDNSVGTKADTNGNYTFPNVAESRYTVSIRTWYDRQEDVPCHLLMATTKDKGTLLVLQEENKRFVEQIFIKGFSVKGGKDVTRDFDIECKSMFG